MLAGLSHLKISVIPSRGLEGAECVPPRSSTTSAATTSNDSMDHRRTQVIAGMEPSPGIVDMNTTSQSGKPEVSHRTSTAIGPSDLGVSVEDLGKAVRH